jgi:putative membrane protein (TIGR04086 family)
MGRSIGAVTVGLLYALAGICLTQLILWLCFPADGDDILAPQPPAYFALTLVCTSGSALLAGFMTAHMARTADLNQGLAVGLLLAALLALTTLVSQRDSPSWYRVTLPVAALPAAALGAMLRTKLRRPPSPAPPSPT